MEFEKKLRGGNWTADMIARWNGHVENATNFVEIEAGRPLFGGSIFESDLIVYLNIDDETLRERTKKRGVAFETASRYNEALKEKLKGVDVPVVVVDV